MNKKVMSYFWFNNHLIYPTLCIPKKKLVAKFVHNYEVEKVRKFDRSSV